MEMATHSSILAGGSHAQRRLVRYSLWSRKESDVTEWLTLSLDFSFIPKSRSLMNSKQRTHEGNTPRHIIITSLKISEKEKTLKATKENETFSSKIRNKTRMPTLTAFLKIVLEVLATVIREEKEIKGIQTRKGVKLSLFADGMILYIEN